MVLGALLHLFYKCEVTRYSLNLIWIRVVSVCIDSGGLRGNLYLLSCLLEMHGSKGLILAHQGHMMDAFSHHGWLLLMENSYFTN